MSMRHKIKYNRGFTLIEMLVVVAIAAILIGLVMGPVTQSFNMTRRAQAMVEAQDTARFGMEQISRELGQAMYVYDNAQTPIEIPVRQPSSTMKKWFQLPFAKIDMVLPRITMHCNNPSHSSTDPRDFPRGDEAWPPCPYCASDDVEARPKLPLEQDVTIVRYFLGLRYNDLNRGFNGGWKCPWGQGYSDPAQENQVLLYRVEFSPTRDAGKLFPADASFQEILTNPKFFYEQPYNEEWKRRARVIGAAKYQDLVIADINSSGEVTKIEPTVTFRTEAIENDTFSGAYSGDKSSDDPNSVPTVFHAKHPYWVPPYNVVVYRDNYNTAYTTAVEGGYFVVKKLEYNSSSKTWDNRGVTFNIDSYRDSTTGALIGEITDGSSPETVEMAFTIDPNRGAVNFALDAPGENGRAPGPAFEMTPSEVDALNNAFRQAYRTDPGSAARRVLLSTFDSDKSSQYMPNARIVPGSERVTGPNMTPGANYGNPVRYERVPLALGDPELNQYKINYDTGDLYFSQRWDQNVAVKRDSSGNIVSSGIEVDYKVQFIRNDDVVKGDYSTKSLINIRLGMRIFDPNSGKPHSIELTNSIKIRNALR